MSKLCSPPYTLTNAIVRRVVAIGEALGRRSAGSDANALRLHRSNRVQTIHGLLAIEGNTLGVAQMTAILDGKRVLAPPRQIQEVRQCDQSRPEQPAPAALPSSILYFLACFTYIFVLLLSLHPPRFQE